MAAAEPKRDPATPGRAVEILLASRSPRRRQLLAEHGYAFRVVDSGVDDGSLHPGPADPAAWVMALAYFKAAAAAARLDGPPPGAVVLGADTVCVIDDRIVGQPRDADDATAILGSFESRRHAVLTGVALLCPGTHRRRLFAETATVRWGEVGPERIAEYVGTGAWRGKAGAYNLHERLDAGWPIEFDGEPGAIVGLPMQRLGRELRAFAASATDAA